MNWTEGNLQRHVRGRGWSRDRSRQRQVFASARTSKVPRGPGEAAEADESPFFTIGALGEPSQPRARGSQPPAEASGSAGSQPPSTKRRRTSPPASYRGDDLEAKRQRLLAREDWTGISSARASSPAQGHEAETASHHFATTSRETPGPHLHHPKPIRRGDGHLVESLESRSVYPHAEEPAPHFRSPYPRVAASGGTEETEETDNLLPLSDTLPDVTVRLDLLDSVEGDSDGGGGGDSTGVADDVSLTALLWSESSSAGGSCGEVEAGVGIPGRQGALVSDWESNDRGLDPRYGEGVKPEAEGGGQDAEDNWMDFVFEEGSEEVGREAFEVARRDAARGLVPSVSSGADSRAVECDSGSGCGGSDRATCGTGS